jgi:hypothetical protein
MKRSSRAISESRSVAGSALPPESPEIIAALCARVSLDRFRRQRGSVATNFGRWVSTTSSGTVLTRSISGFSTSRGGLLSGGRLHGVDQHPQRLILVPLRRHRQGAVARLVWDGQDGGNEPDVCQRAVIVRNDQRFELVEFRISCFVSGKFQRPLEVVDDGPEGAVHRSACTPCSPSRSRREACRLLRAGPLGRLGAPQGAETARSTGTDQAADGRNACSWCETLQRYCPALGALSGRQHKAASGICQLENSHVPFCSPCSCSCRGSGKLASELC